MCFDTNRFDDEEQWMRLAEAMCEELEAGRSVFVHCMAGIHRAPMCAAGALSILRQISFTDAYRFVIASGRCVDPHGFRDYMRKRGAMGGGARGCRQRASSGSWRGDGTSGRRRRGRRGGGAGGVARPAATDRCVLAMVRGVVARC
jgi:hypothetical protein